MYATGGHGEHGCHCAPPTTPRSDFWPATATAGNRIETGVEKSRARACASVSVGQTKVPGAWKNPPGRALLAAVAIGLRELLRGCQPPETREIARQTAPFKRSNRKSMNFSIKIISKDINAFVDHWSGKYEYKNGEKYDQNIRNIRTCEDLTQATDSIRELFKWKNGGPLSANKKISVCKKLTWLTKEQCNDRISICNNAESKYLDPKQSGPIWNIFFLHCLDPDNWPIYDQHTQRAMVYLKTGDIADDVKSHRRVYEIYRYEYKPFILSEFRPLFCDLREVDKALFAFGKFLKTAGRYR
ncbi:MAG: hypothetical protein OXS40_12510 [Gammaproteobacteria bacterium]|nr:hypothetical protein [Gammaproteobacteria bacterium]